MLSGSKTNDQIILPRFSITMKGIMVIRENLTLCLAHDFRRGSPGDIKQKIDSTVGRFRLKRSYRNRRCCLRNWVQIMSTD